MTDEEILCLKVPFEKSILTAAEKECLVKLMLENTAAFSIRDEIGTCPYFEVKLKLRDDKPFFVRAMQYSGRPETYYTERNG